MSSDGFNHESLPTWVRQIAEKAAQPGFERWRQMVSKARAGAPIIFDS